MYQIEYFTNNLVRTYINSINLKALKHKTQKSTTSTQQITRSMFVMPCCVNRGTPNDAYLQHIKHAVRLRKLHIDMMRHNNRYRTLLGVRAANALDNTTTTMP